MNLTLYLSNKNEYSNLSWFLIDLEKEKEKGNDTTSFINFTFMEMSSAFSFADLETCLSASSLPLRHSTVLISIVMLFSFIQQRVPNPFT